ncbi:MULTISPECIES: hypothetical protein [unclassified Hydrogenophaga]|uniref:hypothetical protein n=1 Tax=unclassified Hydrogenophaga TaxID=2610897 RepID=UPI0012E36238|nr:hypothetical protein [Hydrogenophaga sp. Root209]
MRQVVALLCDNLTACAVGRRHSHAGIPEGVDLLDDRIVSVLKVWRGMAAWLHRIGTETFGLWHASGYQKRSKRRCCNAA